MKKITLQNYTTDKYYLKPSITVYKRNTAGAKIPLRFSKTGERNIEEAYSRHFVKPGNSDAIDARNTERL